MMPVLPAQVGCGDHYGGVTHLATGHADNPGSTDLHYSDPPSYLDWSDSGRGSGWRYLSGTVLILLLWFVGQVFVIIPALLALGGDFSPDGTFTTPAPWGNLLISLASFIPFFIATPLIVRFLHGRPALTVVTPFLRLNWRLIAWGAGLWLVPTVLLTIVSLLIRTGEAPRWNYQPGLFWPALLIGVTLLVVQTSAEELFFRGYLLQWFRKVTGNVWVMAAFSGLLFGLPHLANPEVAGSSGLEWVPALLVYFATGFALAAVSVRSGTIELALGAHFINNFVNIVFITAENSALGTPSLWVDGAPGVFEAAAGSVISAAVFIGLAWRFRGQGRLRPLQPPRTPTPPTPASPPAGWFPDPLGAAAYRWWDGSRWTEHIG